jgi:hypothetical protein
MSKKSGKSLKDKRADKRAAQSDGTPIENVVNSKRR